MLRGFCGGAFGRDSYTDKRIEAMGSDWIVVREVNGRADFYQGDLRFLFEYLDEDDAI